MATMSTSSMNLGLGLGQVGYNGPTGPSPASASSSYHHPQQSQHPLPLQQQQQQQQHRPQPDPFSYSNGDAIPGQPGSAQLGLSQNGLPQHAGPSGLHIDTTRGGMGEYAQAHSAGPSTGEPNTGFEHLTAPLRSTHPYLSHQQPSSLPPTHPGMTNGQVAYQNHALPMVYPPNAVPSFVSPSGVQGQFAPQHLPPNHPQQQQQQQQQRPAQPMPGFTFGNPPPMPPHWSNGAVSGPSTIPMGMLPPGVGQGGLPPPPPPPGYVDWDDGDYLDGGDMIYGQLEVKHRRRTTPEQLKVLEHWFDINPKPDNNLREWLAMELGMTKRNVQVWFQNRRAKVKGLAIKEKAAAAKAAQEAAQNETVRTPENGPDTPPNPTVPPAPGGPITRPEITPSPEQPPSSKRSEPDQRYVPAQPAPVAADANTNGPQFNAEQPPASSSTAHSAPGQATLASAPTIRTPPSRPAPLQIQSQPVLPTSLAANVGVPLSALPIPSHQTSLLPPVPTFNMARRASLANGEAARMDAFMAKQRQAARKASAGLAGFRQPSLISPVRSPVMPGIGTANMARRTSGPYPPTLNMAPNGAQDGLQVGYGGPGSPKISPNVRPAPSALHLAAMRNNSRRASMPGVAGQPGAAGQVQLISSGPFTPPRVVSGAGLPLPGSGNGNGNNANRELSPIKDHEDGYGSVNHFVFPDPSDLTTTYLTPPSSTYLPTSSAATYLSDASSASFDLENAPFTPDGPGPNPSFSFGSVGTGSETSMPVIGEADSAAHGQLDTMTQQHIAWMDMQPRVRLGSIASIETYTTEGGTTVDGGSDGWNDWASLGAAQLQPQHQGALGAGANGYSGGMLHADLAGFDPEARRASAPADMLHDLHLGLFPGSGSSNNTTPHRPSPLGNNYAPDPFGENASHDIALSYSNSTNGSGNAYPLASGGYSYPMMDFASGDTASTGSGSLGTSPSDRSQHEIARSQNGKPQLNLSMSGLNSQRPVPARQHQLQQQLQQAGSGDSAESNHTVVTPFSASGMTSDFSFGGLPTSGSVGANGDKEYDWFSAVDGGEVNA